MGMNCDGQPTWREVNMGGQCPKEEEKALEALTERLDGMESRLHQIKKTLEESETNSVSPSVDDVKETTPPLGYKDKKTSKARTSIVPATTPWSTKEAFLSTVLPQTTKVEQSTVRTCPEPKAPDNGTVDTATALEVNQTIKYSCNAGYVLQGSNIGKCGENGTWGEVPTCVECGFVYNLKCFRVVTYDAQNVTFSMAESLCKNKLANIYDVTHHNMVRDYLRSMITDGRAYIEIRTGMTYNHSNGQLYSATGQAMSLPSEVWYHNYPLSYSSHTSVVVRVDRDPEISYQAIIFNYPPSSKYDGAICENEI
uniref:uncharacterized protein LOC120333154 n=1 Tax=Styela clava TaxID=7725 RepID=UPI00193A8485|nr:uncharacterized protein LOC120333154 [Styela clava]